MQPDHLTIALTGDSMLSRSISVFAEEPYLHMRDILKSADVVFTNFEANAHPYLDDPHAQRDGGTYVTTEPHLLDDLKWLGVNLVACGSSHADDYGPKGILDTMRYLDQAGIAHAGSGRHLAEARAPAYVDTARGRVALIAASSQYRPGTRAGDQRYDTLGYPGVNGLRHKVVYNVDKPMLEQLRSIGRAIGWEAAVELHKGKPMLHGIGTFIFQVETMRYLPAEAYERYGLGERATPSDFIAARYQGDSVGHAGDPVQWEQMFALCDFAADDFSELRLYPIDLGFQRRRTDRGRPMLADGAVADRVLARVERLSAKYGTKVDRRDGVGIVRA